MSTTTVKITATDGEHKTPTPRECPAGATHPPCRHKKRVCCCLISLLMLNFIFMLFICHRVHQIWKLFSSDSDLVLMPGGTTSFCNDFCVNMCEVSYDDGYGYGVHSYDCNLFACLLSCKEHFLSDDEKEIMMINVDGMIHVFTYMGSMCLYSFHNFGKTFYPLFCLLFD